MNYAIYPLLKATTDHYDTLKQIDCLSFIFQRRETFIEASEIILAGSCTCYDEFKFILHDNRQHYNMKALDCSSISIGILLLGYTEFVIHLVSMHGANACFL